MQYGSRDVEASIIDATLNCRVFDPQCEPARADWLVEMLVHSDLCQELLAEIAKKPRQATDWDSFVNLDQQAAVIGHLAKNGMSGARELLYSFFQPTPDLGDLIGAAPIISLDGADGLLFVARRLGQWLGERTGFSVDDEPLRLFDEQFGEGEAKRVIEEHALTDSDVWRYAHALRTNDDQRDRAYHSIPAGIDLSGVLQEREMIQARSAEDVIARIQDGSDWSGNVWWGYKAKDHDIRTLFERMLQETDKTRLVKFLRCFARRGFPRFDEKVLAFLEFPSLDSKLEWEPELTIPHMTINGLAGLTDPHVRRMALTSLKEGKLHRGLTLLKANFKPQDIPLIENVMQPVPDESEDHWMIAALLDLFENNPPSASSTPLLLFAYEHSPCSLHRGEAVEQLESLGTTPEWVADECKFDGSPYIRERVQSTEGSD